MFTMLEIVTSYRDRIDMTAAILDIANGNEVSQAKILSKANISRSLFKEYLFFYVNMA